MKKCIECGVEKELSGYYKHGQMADGHLNKCKECVKEGARIRESKLRSDPKWVEKERERGREKYKRLEYSGKNKPDYESKKAQIERYKNRFPEKVKAHRASNSIVATKDCKHHWSYCDGFERDVIHLTKEEHYTLHRFIIYDCERMMYRRADNNVLLDSREAHEDYFKEIMEMQT
jgi:hypothetical protein